MPFKGLSTGRFTSSLQADLRLLFRLFTGLSTGRFNLVYLLLTASQKWLPTTFGYELHVATIWTNLGKFEQQC